MIKRTSLYEEHKRLGGHLIDFGGWELPVHYSGVMDEHLACRQSCGIFDVSHMGEILVEGSDAALFLDQLVAHHVSALAKGQALYTVMCLPQGGIVDDLVIYRRDEKRFLLVVNASRTEKDFQYILSIKNQFLSSQSIGAKQVGSDSLKIVNESQKFSQIALQGRHAVKILSQITNADLNQIKTYWFTEGTILDGIPAIIARTGYTGEDGFEIYVEWGKGVDVWNALLRAGAGFGLKPCGLGARDTLRLEMKYPLYGHELNEEINPLEAGLHWVIRWDKGTFIGRDVLLKIKEAGLKRKLIGYRLLGKNIPRQDYAIYDSDGRNQIGKTTSGTMSPSLQIPIGVGFIQIDHSAVGTKVMIDVRGSKIPAEIVSTPFYKKPY